MKRFLCSAAVIAMFGFAFSTTARADDLAAMAGRWTVESAEAGGHVVDSEDLKSLIVTIEGDHYSLTTKDGPDGGTLKLDETKSPKTMDATDTEGDDIGKVIRAIYEITADTMRVCYALDGSARPTEFATKEGSPWLVVTYRREK